MIGYIIKRLAQSLMLLFGISIISFFIIHMAPGSPIGLTLNPTASPKVIEQMRKNYDLDKPLPVQYGLWIKKLFTGKLYSFKDGRPVLKKIWERLPATLLLNLMSMIFIFSIGIPLGVFSVSRRNTLLDHISTVGAYMGISMPSFWIAYILILLTVRIVGYPVLGIRSFGLENLSFFQLLTDRFWHLLLPSLILSLSGIAVISRYTRSSMIEVLSQDFIRTARAKGLSESEVYYRHALRNSLLPIVTIFGFMVPGLISGSVIIETIFAWPGVGRLAYQAVLARDYSVVMTILTISSALTLLGNLMADIMYALVDPRVRVS